MYSQHAKIECKNMFCFFTIMTLVYFVFEKNSKDIHGCMEQTAHKYFLPQRNLYFLSEKYMSLVDSLVILSKYKSYFLRFYSNHILYGNIISLHEYIEKILRADNSF